MNDAQMVRSLGRASLKILLLKKLQSCFCNHSWRATFTSSLLWSIPRGETCMIVLTYYVEKWWYFGGINVAIVSIEVTAHSVSVT